MNWMEFKNANRGTVVIRSDQFAGIRHIEGDTWEVYVVGGKSFFVKHTGEELFNITGLSLTEELKAKNKVDLGAVA